MKPAPLHILVALLLSGCGTFSGSKPVGQPAIKPIPISDARASRGPQEFSEFMTEGDRSRNEGRISDAAWNYLRAMRRNSESPRPAERIGLLHLAQRNSEEAQAAFELSLRKDPDSAVSHMGLGFALMGQGEFTRSEEELVRARDLEPTSTLPLLALAVLYDAQSRFEDAREIYLAALDRSPENTDILNNLGSSYLMTRDFDQAVEYLQRASELDPSNVLARNNLGLALGQLGRYEEAWEAFREGQTEVEALNNLGYVYFLNGDPETAIRYYEQALALPSPRRAAIVRNLREAEAIVRPAAADAAPSVPVAVRDELPAEPGTAAASEAGSVDADMPAGSSEVSPPVQAPAPAGVSPPISVPEAASPGDSGASGAKASGEGQSEARGLELPTPMSAIAR